MRCFIYVTQTTKSKFTARSWVPLPAFLDVRPPFYEPRRQVCETLGVSADAVVAGLAADNLVSLIMFEHYLPFRFSY